MMGRLIGIVIGICALLAWFAGSASAEDKILLLNSGAPNTVLCSRLGCERIDFTNSATFDEQSGKDNAQKIQEWAETLDSSTPKFLIVDGKYAIADHDDDGIDILWPEIIGGGIYTLGRSTRASYLTSGLAEGGFVDNSAGFFHVGTGAEDDIMVCYPGSNADLQLRLVGAVCQNNAQLYSAVGDDLSLALSGAVYDHTGNAEGERHLSLTGAFAGYTPAQGDVICFTGASNTTNVPLGWHTVGAKVDSDAILLHEEDNCIGDATGISSTDAPTRAGTGLLIRHTATSPSGAKVRLSISGQILQTVTKTDFVDEPNHADNIWIDLIQHRWCDHQIWSYNNGQAVGWTIFKSDNDGSPCKSLFRFDVAGDLTCFDCYHPNGTLLKIGAGVTGQTSYFKIVTQKLDNVIAQGPRCVTLDCEDTDSFAQVEIGGSNSSTPDHQMVRVAQSQLINQPDVQLKIKNMSEVEQRAYPIRPYRGAYMPKPYEASAFASTVFWLDPDTDAGLTLAGAADATLDSSHGGRITQVADLSASDNDISQTFDALTGAVYDHTGNLDGERCLTLAGAFTNYTWASGDTISIHAATGGVATAPTTYIIAARVDDDAILLVAAPGLTGDATGVAAFSSKPAYNKKFGINWRPSLDFTSAILGAQMRLTKASPADVADGFTDLTVMAVIVPRTFSNNQCIIQCQESDATGGFLFWINTAGKAVFRCGPGAAEVVSSYTMSANRPYLLIGQRDNSTGDLYITVNGVRNVNITPATGAIDAVSGNLNIGSRLTNSTWDIKYRGHIGEIFIDKAFWDMSNPVMTEWPDAEARERVNYLRGGWGVW